LAYKRKDFIEPKRTQASKGAPGRPFVHLISSSCRPRREAVELDHELYF
jgi:hypothetical protein